MNYTQTLEFLFSSLPTYEVQGGDAYKPGLDRIAQFCRHLGNPQRNFYTIHIAGTNGKGSVSHMIASVLEQAGYRVGLFTSPHLKDFRERIRVDSEKIAKQRVVNFVDKYRDKMVEMGLSFFEMSAALAFDHFAHSDVEVAIIETGLGGRLDATNIITPIVSVVTNVGMDHTSLLGDTIELIAAEKAGIIKKSIPVIIGESNPEYNEIFEGVAKENKSKVIYAQDVFICTGQTVDQMGQHLTMRRKRDDYNFEIDLDLCGTYQLHNALTASAVVDFLHEETPISISRRAYLEGLRTAASHTGFMGRWQKIGEKPLVICDTGHNAHGMTYIAEELAKVDHHRLYCVLGFVRDKDLLQILPLLPKTAKYIFTQPANQRAMDANELAAMAESLELRGEVITDVKSAVERARELAKEDDMIFIGGSTYVVGEAL